MARYKKCMIQQQQSDFFNLLQQQRRSKNPKIKKRVVLLSQAQNDFAITSTSINKSNSIFLKQHIKSLIGILFASLSLEMLMTCYFFEWMWFRLDEAFIRHITQIYRMGCSSPQNATMPNIPAAHLNRLLQVSDINHQLNVNKKYQHLQKIRDGPLVGQGFKKTYTYECMTTPDELKAKRKQFWEETRVNGLPQCWNAIKMAVEQPNQQTGSTILHSVRVSMLNNSIQMCVDSRFNKYEVPVFCINEPLSYAHETIAEKNLNYEYSDAIVNIKVRSAMFPNDDIKLSLSNATEIEAVKSTLRVTKQILADKNIRLFYNGREMIDNKTLGNYNYCEGTIVQAMIR